LGGVDDLEEYRIELNTDMRLDQRRYNVPISSEVAAIWVEGSELCKYFERSIVLFGNDNKRYSIQPYYGCYDPLSYPLFFPRGEIGWHPEIPKNSVNLNEMLQSRRCGRQSLDTVNDYSNNMWLICTSRLKAQDWTIKKHQKQIRADLYQGVVDRLQAGENRADEVGKRTIVPSSFIGGRRDRR
uniref:Helitron helicase-like domain-containing protein n=1 Tax=Aegilops tauschii subsp. strangulata TaxID=200361 RepID=A0A453IA13_AEGTS